MRIRLNSLLLVVLFFGLPLVLIFPLSRSEAANGELSISPGQSIQAVVDAHPPGTTFRIKAGIFDRQPRSFTPPSGWSDALLHVVAKSQNPR